MNNFIKAFRSNKGADLCNEQTRVVNEVLSKYSAARTLYGADSKTALRLYKKWERESSKLDELFNIHFCLFENIFKARHERK